MAHSQWLRDLGSDLAPAWGGLLRTHQELVTVMNYELVNGHGMTLNSYDVLRHLALAPAGGLRMRDLAEEVMLTRPGLTGVVGRLEDAGLVRREPDHDDGRGVCAHITPEGLRRLRLAHATHVASIRRHFADRLSSEDLRTLSGIWGKLATATDPARGATDP